MIFLDNLIIPFCNNSQDQNNISLFKLLEHLAGSMSGMELWHMVHCRSPPVTSSNGISTALVSGTAVVEGGFLLPHSFLS